LLDNAKSSSMQTCQLTHVTSVTLSATRVGARDQQPTTALSVPILSSTGTSQLGSALRVAPTFESRTSKFLLS